MKHPHPQYDKYVEEKEFAKFTIDDGNIVWGEERLGLNLPDRGTPCRHNLIITNTLVTVICSEGFFFLFLE